MELASRLAHAASVFAEQTSVAATVEQIARLAVEVVPGTDAAAVGERPGTVATAGPLANACEAVQRRLGVGPAELEPDGEVVLVDLETEQRWPGFRERARGLGVRGVAVCDLRAGRAARARLTLYAAHAFEPDITRVAGLYATHASVALSHAHQIAHLSSAMRTRGRIGQAVGLLMQRHRLPADEAFELLTRASQQVNVKLRDLADIVVDTGVEPREAADLARRAAKDAGTRADELRPWRASRTGPPASAHLDEDQQRARLAAARAITRPAEASALRKAAGDDGDPGRRN